jgi:hypothetical protein
MPGADCATVNGQPTFSSSSNYTFKADHTFSVSGSISFSVDVSFDDACAMSSFGKDAAGACAALKAASAQEAQLGFTVNCTLNGAVCECQESAEVAQDESGTYSVDGSQITITPDATQSSSASTPLDGTSDFCVDGNTVTVQGSDGTIATLEK